MEELHLGPNGGLVHCMEYLEENLEDWLADELQNFAEDDYIVSCAKCSLVSELADSPSMGRFSTRQDKSFDGSFMGPLPMMQLVMHHSYHPC